MSQMSSSSRARPQSIATVHQQIERIRAGLSFRSVENLQKSLNIPMDKIATALGISRATLHRRRLQGRLDKAESERVVRYELLLKKAADVFGSKDDARRWLTHPQPSLGNIAPLEFAKTELGAREVENLLGRLEYSVYS
jgi:putative toxin-antitoxin system antitoxin component (TIGR02293 family)